MSSEETKNIVSFLRVNGWPMTFDDYWIGLTDQETEGKFVWSSTGQVPEYTNWESGEAPVEDEIRDCVQLKSSLGLWRESTCYRSSLYALCEKGLCYARGLKLKLTW
jgi:hypothetical protein